MTRRIVLVDDHTLFRNGLRGLLERQEGYRVVGAAVRREEFLAQLDTLAADVVLMDFSMPGLDGAQTPHRAHAPRPLLEAPPLPTLSEPH